MHRCHETPFPMGEISLSTIPAHNARPLSLFITTSLLGAISSEVGSLSMNCGLLQSRLCFIENPPIDPTATGTRVYKHL
jgi:hypothetical protein